MFIQTAVQLEIFLEKKRKSIPNRNCPLQWESFVTPGDAHHDHLFTTKSPSARD